MEQPETFQSKLESLINQYSLENGSDTPDFILAEYLDGCLQVYDKALKARDKWYQFKPFDNSTTDIRAGE